MGITARTVYTHTDTGMRRVSLFRDSSDRYLISPMPTTNTSDYDRLKGQFARKNDVLRGTEASIIKMKAEKLENDRCYLLPPSKSSSFFALTRTFVRIASFQRLTA